MIEIQCTSCQTRYRIDERILPDDTPTFKCSRCGHVFSAEPRQRAPRPADVEDARGPRRGNPSHAPPPRRLRVFRHPRPAVGAKGTAASAAARASARLPRQRRRSARRHRRLRTQAAASQAAAAQAGGLCAGCGARRGGPGGGNASGGGPAVRRAAAAKARPASVPGRGAPVLTSPPAPPIEQEPENVADLQAHQEEPVPAWRDSSELLETRFGGAPTDEAEKQGENLAFNFSDEPRRPRSQPIVMPRTNGRSAVPKLLPLRRLVRSTAFVSLTSTRTWKTRASTGLLQSADQLADRERQISIAYVPKKSASRRMIWRRTCAAAPISCIPQAILLGCSRSMVLGFGIMTVVIQSAPIASAGLLSVLPIVGEGLDTANLGSSACGARSGPGTVC